MAAQQRAAPDAVASLRDATGRLIGDATFRHGDGQVLLTIVFASQSGLTGAHGVRVHSVGRCDPPDFLTAGDGFNPTDKQHGLNNPAGPQVGDLPNVEFSADNPPYAASIVGAILASGPNSLLGVNGTALIVYS